MAAQIGNTPNEAKRQYQYHPLPTHSTSHIRNATIDPGKSSDDNRISLDQNFLPSTRQLPMKQSPQLTGLKTEDRNIQVQCLFTDVGQSQLGSELVLR
jgi:hypothetical protein